MKKKNIYIMIMRERTLKKGENDDEGEETHLRKATKAMTRAINNIATTTGNTINNCNFKSIFNMLSISAVVVLWGGVVVDGVVVGGVVVDGVVGGGVVVGGVVVMLW